MLNMLNTLIDMVMLFGIASILLFIVGGLIKIIKHLCEKVLKINIVAWLTSDDK